MHEIDQRALPIFISALEVGTPEERSKYLDEACGDDPELRKRVEVLLAAQKQTNGFLVPEWMEQDMILEGPGTVIGHYKLLERIGEGAFGVVFMADQVEPIRRRVALKIVKPGMDTKQVIVRFEAERQALALMDHPNIARVFDAGATETGRPYFVMELVHGVPITKYCDDNKLTRDERLRLFIPVCAALQHAHQKGVIHRDIKPSNILVTLHDGIPMPKVIDFGTAKALQHTLTDKTMFTAYGKLVGTPQYMSPEQAEMSGLDVDTRADVYALGVLLYELLTGTTPFETERLRSVAFEKMMQMIREEDPPKPSARVSTLGALATDIASHRQLDPNGLERSLRGDLDWIVMKCLEKNRTRRYDTANGLAMDIQRYLNTEPIEARPPSKLYEFQRTVRRHTFGFAMTAAIIIVLSAGVVVSSWQAKRASSEAMRANLEATRATTTLNELRETAPAFVSQARTLVTAERYDEAIEKLDYAIQLQPDDPTHLLYKAHLLRCQLQLSEAVTLYREALRLNPELSEAEESAHLCEELLAAEPAEDGGLSRESHATLLSAMERQERPAAEMLPVAKMLQEESKWLRDHWLEKLKDLPISPDWPLEERLTIAEEGLLNLDLSGTTITDLEPLRGMPLNELYLNYCTGINNLEPLAGAPLRTLWMPGLSSLDSDSIAVLSSLADLKHLNLAGSNVSDLSPLHGLPLVELLLTDAPVYDISPLRGMLLEKLVLRGTRVADLSPLAGMPLSIFDATNIPADDYSPLNGALLETCLIQNSPIRDLSFLEGSPVKELVLLGCHDALGYAVLEGLVSLNLLILPDSYRNLPAEELAAIAKLRNSTSLKNIDTSEHRSRRGSSFMIGTAQTADEFWQEWDRLEAIISYLKEKGCEFALRQLDSGNYRLDIMDQPLSDLSFLEDTPIEELLVQGTQVSDLRPLAKLPLRLLDIRRTQVTDLSPLRSPELSANLRELHLWQIPAQDFSAVSACVNLEYFDAAGTALANLDVVRGRKLSVALLSGTKITDISALAGMPLERVTLTDTEVTDIKPLLQCPNLTYLAIPSTARDVEALKTLPMLKRLSLTQIGGFPTQSTEEFWSGYESSGITPETISMLLEDSMKDPKDTILALKLAALQVWFGLDAEYAATCERMFEWSEREAFRQSYDLERVAKIAALTPATDASIREASLRLARKAMKVGEYNPGVSPWIAMTLGMAEYRNGHFQAAEEALSMAELAPRTIWQASVLIDTAAFYHAMSLFRQARADEALEIFTATEARIGHCPAEDEPLPLSVNHDELIMWLAYKEARSLLQTPIAETMP